MINVSDGHTVSGTEGNVEGKKRDTGAVKEVLPGKEW